MDNMLSGILVAVVILVVGFALYPVVVGAINNANLSADQEYLGTLAKTLYILGISLISVVIVFMSVKSLKGHK
jgi:uncharacterized membrane protein YqhA